MSIYYYTMKDGMRWDTIILFIIILVVIFVLIGLGNPEYLLDDIRDEIFRKNCDLQYSKGFLKILKDDYATCCKIPEHLITEWDLGIKRHLEQSISVTQERVDSLTIELREMRAQAEKWYLETFKKN